jgi:hypothetical protein
MEDVDKLDNIRDGFIHYQLIRFCHATRLQYVNGQSPSRTKTCSGLAAAKAAALRINLNVEGCGIVAAPVHVPSRAPLLLPLLLSHKLPLPRVH